LNHTSAASESTPIDYQEALERTLGAPFTAGNQVKVLRNGIEIFPSMLEAIRQAHSTIEFLTFIYWTGDIAQEFAEALSERARAGVQVRVILDAVGAAKMSNEWLDSMNAAGVDIAWFRPPVRWKIWEVDNRTHRKVLVCDDKVAFTGGVGISKEWEGDTRNSDEWRDTHFRIEGPAVNGVRAAFTDNWVETDRSVRDEVEQMLHAKPRDAVGSCRIQAIKTSAAVNWSPIATMFHVLLTLARHKVRIATAYFVPDPGMVRLLKETAERGVDIEILIPGPHHDERVAQLAQEDEYIPLLQAGVRMWAYQPSMMHTKTVIIDDAVACIGSANFNQRSMSKDDELALLLIDDTTVRELDGHFDEDCARATELTTEHLHRRGPLRKLLAKFVGLFRQQM